MKTRRISLKKYLIFSKAGLLEVFAYKFHIWAWLFVGVISVLLRVFLWSAVYKNSPSDVINGFTFTDMMRYTLIMSFVGQLMHSSDSFYMMGMGIRSGDIVMSLIKPISFRRQLAFTTFGYFVANLIIAMLPMFSIYLVVAGVSGLPLPSVQNVLLCVVSMLLSALMIDSVGLAVGSLAVHTGAIFGLGQLYTTFIGFLSGALIPIAFFPSWAQSVLMFTPFPSMLTTPTQILMGDNAFLFFVGLVGVQLAWTVGLYLLGSLCYFLVSKRFISNGG